MDDIEAIPAEKVHGLPIEDEAGQEIDHTDADIVTFNGSDDVANPHNWSPRYKWMMVILVSTMSLVV